MEIERIFSLTDDEFIKVLYRELLGKEADADGIRYYLDFLRRQKYPRTFVVRSLKDSEAYRLRKAKSDIPARVLQNKKLNDEEVLAGKTSLQSKPVTFLLDLIGMCNMKPPCVMCLNWKDETGPRYHQGLTADDLLVFGETLQLASEIINCSIGEPLILKDLIPVLELFSAWEKPFGINSNGLALTPGLTEKLVPYFDILTITFSVDAATPETYARIRGDHFIRIIENIAYYCKRRREIHPEGTASKTGMVMIPMRINRLEVSAFVRLAAWLGVDVVELRSLNEIGGEWNVTREDFVFDYRREILSNQELEEVRREAEKTAAECGIILDCQYEVSEEKTYGAFLPEDKQEGKIKCVQPWRSILPLQDGVTFGCCYMTRSLGNWRLEGLEALWNGKRMQKLRRELAAGVLPEECRDYASCPVVKANLAPTSKNAGNFAKGLFRRPGRP
jgi:MoaA/NifB/PqqE/SkfB family radical SAM enzyme